MAKLWNLWRANLSEASASGTSLSTELQWLESWVGIGTRLCKSRFYSIDAPSPFPSKQLSGREGKASKVNERSTLWSEHKAGCTASIINWDWPEWHQWMERSVTSPKIQHIFPTSPCHLPIRAVTRDCWLAAELKGVDSKEACWRWK